jgi:hypothetical protein
MGTGSSIPGVKGQKLEADHSPPSSAEVKNSVLYLSYLDYMWNGYMTNSVTNAELWNTTDINPLLGDYLRSH